MDRGLAFLFTCVAFTGSRSAEAEPAATTPFDPDTDRPIGELDVYRDMAELFRLAGISESVLVGAGGGVVDGGMGTLDVAYRRRNFDSAWDLLPTTLGSGLWVRPARGGPITIPISIGWRIVFGLFDGPYLTANGVGAWSPSSSDFDAGFDAGGGYEWRAGRRWSIAADARLVGLWSLGDRSGGEDREPWGVRASVFVRRYLGDVDPP
ncbi:MAG: hypothetical protein AB7P03_13150 [Kofleriaceae bacterium]